MEEVTVRAVPGEVFAYVADPATLPEWCGVAGELIPVEGASKSSVVVGSTFRMLPAASSDEPYYAWKDRTDHAAYVTSLVPGSRIEWRLDRGRPLHIVVEMQGRARGTRVTLDTRSGEPLWLRWIQSLLLLPVVPLRWIQSRSRESNWLSLIKSRVELGQRRGVEPPAKGDA
jgi:uncharacterized protein YndB with AHSA1/START domain